jgi:hypothetical protein
MTRYSVAALAALAAMYPPWAEAGAAAAFATTPALGGVSLRVHGAAWQLGPSRRARTTESLLAARLSVANGLSLGEQVRDDFPLLKQKVHDDKQLIYLDSAATSQKPIQVSLTYL